jgi:hypothetical protein
MSEKNGTRKERADSRRRKILESLTNDAMTESWATATNPVKRRIGRLEVAWRDGIQWLAEDIRKMFLNFTTIADAYDIADVNLAAIKSLCIDKGIFTDEDFEVRRAVIMKFVDEDRQRRQAELDELTAAAAARTEEAEAAETSLPVRGLDREAVTIRDAVLASKDESHIPKSATLF